MENPFNTTIGAATIIIATSALYTWYQHTRRQQLPLPPGPPRLPLLGNTNFPQTQWYDKFWELLEKHGDVVYLEVLGQSTIILGSVEVAEELLSKRASNYSRRSESFFRMDILDMRWRLPMLQPGQIHQDQRKLLRRVIGPQELSKHQHLVASEVHALLSDLNGFSGEPSRTVAKRLGSIIIQLTYGKELWMEKGQELVDLNVESMRLIASAFTRFWLVDYIHWLRFIPSWMPGAQFQRIGIKATWLQDRIRQEPFDYALKYFEKNGSNGSLATELIESGDRIDVVRDVLGILYSVGVETTTSVIVNFMYAMVLYPGILKKIQREIDSVVGSGRLPGPSDRQSLPYVESAWKESLRWHVSVPMGVPHVSAEEDNWRGLRIPKETTFIPHVGYMLRDGRIFEDPEVYRPERWLADDADTLPDPTNVAFGFGTRICAGKHIADKIGFAMISAIVSLYDILPLEGEERPKSAEYIDSGIRSPKNFKCRFVPRSEAAHHLLKDPPL